MAVKTVTTERCSPHGNPYAATLPVRQTLPIMRLSIAVMFNSRNKPPHFSSQCQVPSLTAEQKNNLRNFTTCTEDKSMNGCLFADEDIFPWKAEWKNMPEYSISDLSPRYQLIINFACAADIDDFSTILGQNIKANESSKQLQSIWFPEQEIGRIVNKRYISRES